MRSTSKVTVMLARLLFVSQAAPPEFLHNPERTRELIAQTSTRLGPEGATIALAEVAYEFGRYPETAADHMRACLCAVDRAAVTVPVPLPRTAVTR